MPVYHFPYGGSTWDRTLACPGWRRQAALAPAGPRFQQAADRGTLLHSSVVEMHRLKLKAQSMIGFRDPQVQDQSVTPIDAQKALIPAHAALLRFMGRMRPRFEVQVEHSAIAGGTADALGESVTLGRMADFKFGSIRVRAKDNHQLLFYASAHHWPSTVKRVELAIIQPGARPVLDVVSVARRELEAYRYDVLRAVTAAERPGAPLKKGPHCEWCPAKRALTCPQWNRGTELLDPARIPRSGFFSNLKGA